jgi:hypothetical protein
MEAACIVPPPRRRASPAHKTIGWVCSSAPLPRKPFINGSRGEGQPPARGRGPSGRKKRKRPCLRFFPFRAASCRPASIPPQRGFLCPPGFSACHHAMRSQAPRLTQVKQSPPEDWLYVTFTGFNLLKLLREQQPYPPAGDRRRPPGDEAGGTAYRRIPRNDGTVSRTKAKAP